MKKGIVMDIDSQYITLLTREGEFLKAKNQKDRYKIGEEIDFFPSTEFSNSKRSLFQINKWRMAIASSIAVLLIFLSFFPYYLNNKVYAYMSIDVNPSLELGVNRDLKVVSLEALNNDGKKIATQLNEWKQKSVEDVTNAIISKCKQEGYLKEGNSVLIATVMNRDNKQVEENLQHKIAKLSTNYKQKDINVETVTAKKEERQKAKSQGISTGQLLKIENKLDHQTEKDQSSTSGHQKENKSNGNGNGIINKKGNNGNTNGNGNKSKKNQQKNGINNKEQKFNKNNGNHGIQNNEKKTNDNHGKALKKSNNGDSKLFFNKNGKVKIKGNNQNSNRNHNNNKFNESLLKNYESFVIYSG